MEEHVIYLGLGSNLGNRLNNLKAAVNNLTPQLNVLAKSPIYETPPIGYTEQPPFLNQVLKALTYEDPEPLLGHLKRLEIALGRQPGIPNGPRLIDLDILFYDDLVQKTPSLTIPHPRLHERGFVLVPLNDLAPDLVHPLLNLTIHELLNQCDVTGIQVYGREISS